MLGRVAILKRMLDALTKPIPDHLQMVGSRFAGKTVILNELAMRLRDAGQPYTAVLLWDLGHQTPANDNQFMRRFASELSGALCPSHIDYSEHLKTADGSGYDGVGEVLDALKEEGHRVLAILDGFDKPLSNGDLTRNLWDQLRELALKSSLRLVTSSRLTLRELIRQPDAQTSDFWNIFDPTPVRIGCFDQEDLTTILDRLPALSLTSGARTELWNATNGFPVMMLEVLNCVTAGGTTSEIVPEAMRRFCQEAFPSLADKIDSLWADCTPAAQDLLRRVVENGTLSRTGLVRTDVDALVDKGFVHESTGKLQRPNWLLSKYLEELPNEGSTLERLFGTSDACRIHLRGVLQRRIAQIAGIDATFRRYLEMSVQDFPDHPNVFLTHVRGVVDYAFDMIWKAELQNRKIPNDWILAWQYQGERIPEEWQRNFPQGRGRLRLLDQMTGTDKSKPVTQRVKKDAYVLLNAANAFGDFGQHQDGAHIDTHMAYAGLHTCIELAATLIRQLRAE
jgi:hypothetical protein